MKERDDIHPDLSVEDIFQRIVRMSAYRERSTKEVRIKLQEKDISGPLVDEALELAVEKNIVNDKRFAGAFFRTKLNDSFGVEGIERLLEEHNIPEDVIQNVITENYPEYSYESELRRAIAYLEHHPSRSVNQREGNINKLRYKGYGLSVAMAASKHFS